MALPPELHDNWDALSLLLDEALTLPVESRAAFVNALDGERASLRDTLRQLLAQAGGAETSDFLGNLPQFTQSAARGPLADLAPGDTIGPYRLERELGAGGMGSVWLAERADGTLKRRVALKLPRLAWAKGLAERMARERDILATLEHPQIARLYDAGLDQMGRPYLALEYVEGQPIDVYARERNSSVRQKLDLLLQVCAAVAFAHSRLVVHRDLKPSNILVTANGQVRLLDFGIAKLMEGDSANETQLTQLAGRALTLDYASPEQIKGEPIGTASDVYSLGVVAYELLTGSRPYKLKRGSAAELEEAIATIDAPLASSVPADPVTKKALRGDLDAILNKTLKKDPEERYSTVDALAEETRRHFAGEPVLAAPDSLLYRLRKFVLRNKAATLVSAMLAAALLGGAYAEAAVMFALAGGFGVALWQRNRALRAAEEARAQAALAEQHRARATQVKDFLLHLMVTSDTDSGSTAQTTVSELLRKASFDLDASLNLDVEAMLDLKATIGSALISLGAPTEALRLLEPAVSSLSDTQRNSSVGMLAGFRYGEALHECLKSESAIAVLTEVAERARRRGATVIEVKAKQTLSGALINAGQPRDALALVQDAALLAERLDPVAHAVVRSHVFSAVVNVMRSCNEPGVLPAARRAVAVAEQTAKVGKVSRLVAAVMLADAEVSEGDLSVGIRRYAELETPFIEALGADHPLTGAFHSWMGSACMLGGMPDVAIEKLTASLAPWQKGQSESSSNEPSASLRIAQCHAQKRNFKLVADWLDSLQATLAKPGQPPELVTRFRDQRLLLALEQGLTPPAGLFDDAYWTQPPPDEAARLCWVVRRLWLDQVSDRVIAPQSVRDARTSAARASSRAQRWSESVLLARIACNAELHDEVQRILEPLIPELQSMQAPDSPLLATARTVLGQAHLAAGDAESASPLFAAAERSWQAIGNAEEVARVQVLCARSCQK